MGELHSYYTKARWVYQTCDGSKGSKQVHEETSHAVQTFDEVVSQLSNCKYSLLDQKSGYWQVQMDDQSADICMFITPHGRYQYTRLPMGLASAHDVFQNQSDQTFSDIRNVYCIVDGILITAPSQKEHNAAIQKIFQGC